MNLLPILLDMRMNSLEKVITLVVQDLVFHFRVRPGLNLGQLVQVGPGPVGKHYLETSDFAS